MSFSWTYLYSVCVNDLLSLTFHKIASKKYLREKKKYTDLFYKPNLISSSIKNLYHSTINDLDCVEFRQPRLGECVTVLFDSFCLCIFVHPLLFLCTFFAGLALNSSSAAFQIRPVDTILPIFCEYVTYNVRTVFRIKFQNI